MSATTKRVVIIVLGAVALIAAVTGFLFFRSGEGKATTTEATSGEVWTCSMHPQIRMSKPGKCPICEMPLIRAAGTKKKSADEHSQHGPDANIDETHPTFQLSEHARSMASVETVTVERRALTNEMRAVGKIQYNETALAAVVSRVDGYVERLYVDYTGVQVNPGDHLVDIYSPDLVVAQQELLVALSSGASNSSLVEASRLKLLRFGLTEKQVNDLIQNRKVSERVTLFSPIQGTVTEKMVVQKNAVKAGDVLYRLANLESVWVYLDVYEYELAWVRPGQLVEFTSEAFPGETFTGRIWFVNPVLTEETRTVKVLVNISNTDQKLRPGMFVSATIRVPLLANGQPAPTGVEGQFTCPMHPNIIQPEAGKCPICGMELVQIPGNPNQPTEQDREILAVPTLAVLDSGVRKLVYVERARGEYMPVEVTLGPRAGNFYPVLKGLKGGERVVVRGNFLLDSQFQIGGLPSLFYKEGEVAPAGHQHGGNVPTSSNRKPAADEHKNHAPSTTEHKH